MVIHGLRTLQLVRVPSFQAKTAKLGSVHDDPDKSSAQYTLSDKLPHDGGVQVE